MYRSPWFVATRLAGQAPLIEPDLIRDQHSVRLVADLAVDLGESVSCVCHGASFHFAGYGQKRHRIDCQHRSSAEILIRAGKTDGVARIGNTKRCPASMAGFQCALYDNHPEGLGHFIVGRLFHSPPASLLGTPEGARMSAQTAQQVKRESQKWHDEELERWR